MQERAKFKNSTIVSAETYKYNTAGRLVEYSKENIEEICSSFNQSFPPDASFSYDNWNYGYKYNHAGVREQKRIILAVLFNDKRNYNNLRFYPFKFH
jgi:hypothetical protein